MRLTARLITGQREEVDRIAVGFPPPRLITIHAGPGIIRVEPLDTLAAVTVEFPRRYFVFTGEVYDLELGDGPVMVYEEQEERQCQRHPVQPMRPSKT